VAKNPNGTYRPGKRSRDWLKIKPQMTVEAIVRGWEWGKGQSNQDRCGALKLEMMDEHGRPNGVLTTAGFDSSPGKASALSTQNAVVELAVHGISETGKPRHPVIKRLRPDRTVAA
jgi:ATP-dependent DNA ligase